MLRKLCLLAALSAFLLSHSAIAGTFGKVVSIGGQAADVALDEPRGVLYVADFTANRIEVMSLATKTIQTALNVMPQPYSISMSPDGHWLLVAHYGNIASPGSPANALTLIDLRNNYAKQTFTLPEPPLGLAFGSDNRALIVTTQNFLIFDPTFGTTQVLISIADQVVKTIPQPPQSFPQNIVAASVGASADGNWIYGFGDTLIFRYNVPTQTLNSSAYGATPPLGPRAVSVAQDGSFAAMGWIMTDQQGRQFAEFPNPLGTLNVGGHAVDSVAGLVYSQVQQNLTDPPVLTVRAADNLTLIESLQLPENLAGRAVLSSDRQTMYASSASGVLVLPVGNLNASPRLSASVEDLVFSGNFCDRTLATQTFILSGSGRRQCSVQYHVFQFRCERLAQLGHNSGRDHGASRPQCVCRRKWHVRDPTELHVAHGGEPSEERARSGELPPAESARHVHQYPGNAGGHDFQSHQG